MVENPCIHMLLYQYSTHFQRKLNLSKQVTCEWCKQDKIKITDTKGTFLIVGQNKFSRTQCVLQCTVLERQVTFTGKTHLRFTVINAIVGSPLLCFTTKCSPLETLIKIFIIPAFQRKIVCVGNMTFLTFTLSKVP